MELNILILFQHFRAKRASTRAKPEGLKSKERSTSRDWRYTSNLVEWYTSFRFPRQERQNSISSPLILLK